MASAEQIAGRLSARNRKVAGPKCQKKRKKLAQGLDASQFVGDVFSVRQQMHEAGSDVVEKKRAARSYAKLRKKYGI